MSTSIFQLVARNDRSPPPYEDAEWSHPTLLTSWWTTLFSAVIILVRVCGRYIRSETLFREDKIMFFSLIPLFARMAFIHVVLIYQTNNVQIANLTPQDIYQRSIGSRLVLASRIFYAMFIWTAKLTVSEFLKRLTANSWNKTQQYILQCIRGFLLFTFISVVLGTLVECHPFDHYWQVVPDPGPWCRQGYVQLMVMGICDILTDILLIIFPIPIIIKSHMTITRRVQLCLLFSLSVLNIVITAYRVPVIINSHFRQQLRSLWASYEILAAAAVTNALILGSFIRDRGVKKKSKFRTGGQAGTAASDGASINRTMTKAHWGSDSDENLFRSMGGRMNSLSSVEDDELAKLPGYCGPSVLNPSEKVPRKLSVITRQLEGHSSSEEEEGASASSSTGTGHRAQVQYVGSYYRDIGSPDLELHDQLPHERQLTPAKATSSHWTVRDHNIAVDLRRSSDGRGPDDVSFFDVGGILEEGGGPKSMAPLEEDAIEPRSGPSNLNAFSFNQQQPQPQVDSTIVLVQDFAAPRPSGKAYSSDGHSEISQSTSDIVHPETPLGTSPTRMKISNRFSSLANFQNPLAKRSEDNLSFIAEGASTPGSTHSGKKPQKGKSKLAMPGELVDAGGLLS